MRTLDDIIPPSRRKESEPLSRLAARGPGHPPQFPYATLLAIVAVVALSIGALFYFSNAKVEVTPNTVSVAVQGSFSATQSTGSLPYEIITVEKIASQSVKASGTKAANSSASGTITIYNAQAKAQTLVANTRFATTAGLIFRIRTAVTIPGGSSAKPGSITAKVYADKPGDAYNVGPTSFSVPGFAGTPQAMLVYARSSAAMTGGASGNVPVIDVAVEQGARTALADALAPDLRTSLEAQVPTGYVLLPGATSFSYNNLAPAPSETTGMAEVRAQGTATAVVFPNAALAGAIASSIGGVGYQNEPLTLASTNSLTLAAPAGLPTPEAASFDFTLSGTAPLVYTVDPTRVAAAVSGKTRSAAEVALTNYPEIKRAIIILRPFWRQVFPQDPASISIVVANP